MSSQPPDAFQTITSASMIALVALERGDFQKAEHFFGLIHQVVCALAQPAPELPGNVVPFPIRHLPAAPGAA